MRDEETLALLREAAQVLQDENLTREVRGRRADEALDALLHARFAAEETHLTDAAKAAALENLLAVGNQSGRSRARFSRPWQRESGPAISPRSLAWRYASVFAAIAGLLALLFLTRGRPPVRNEQIVRAPHARELVKIPSEAAHGMKPALQPGIQVVKSPPRPGPGIRPKRRVAPPPDRPLVARVEAGVFTGAFGAPRYRIPGEAYTRIGLPNAVLYAGTQIETGDADQAIIRLKDGTKFRLGFNTVFRLRPVGEADGKAFELSSGSVHATVAHQPAGKGLAVRTPAATAQVVGTEFALRIRRRTAAGARVAMETGLTVKEGTVVFYNDHGRVECPRMTESFARSDARPTTPRKIRYIRSFGNVGIVVHSERLTLSDCSERLMWEPGWTGLLVADRFVPGKPLPWQIPLDAKEIPLVTAPTVASVERGSPADGAGIRKGDVLLRIGSAAVTTARQAGLAIHAMPPGRLIITFRRGVATRTAALRTIRNPDWKYPRLPAQERRLVDAGTRLFLAGDLSRSEAAYRAALRQTDSAAAYNNLGLVLEYEGRLPEAVGALKSAVRRRPRVALYAYNLGLALLDVGNPDRAIQSFESAARLARKWEDPYEQSARTCTDYLDDPASAVAVVDRWLRVWPGSPAALTARAHALRVAGRPTEALQAARRAIRLAPDWIGSDYAEAADTYRVLGHADAAERMYRRALDLSAGRPHLFSGIAFAFADQGRLAEAVSATRYAVRLEPDDFVFYGNLSHFYRLLGKLDLAVDYARKAVTMEPRYGVGILILADALLASGHLEEAESVARRGVEASPDRAVSLNALGLVLAERNRIVEAEKCFRDVIALDPYFATGYGNLASMLYRLGRPGEAEEYAKKALQLQPRDAQSNWNIGMLYVALRRLAEAEKCFRAAYALAPDDPRNAKAIADVCREQKKYTEAERFYVESIRKGQSDWNTHLRLAGMYEELARLAEAEKEFRAAAELGPDKVLAMGQLALFLSRQHRADGGLSTAERCVALAHDSRSKATAWGFMGLVRQRRNELDRAEKAFRESLALDQRAITWDRLAAVLEQAGRSKDAVEAYHRALALDPKDVGSKGALKRLEPASGGNPP